MLTHKVRGGQFINLSAIDAGIEAKVEVLKGARFPEIGGFAAPGKDALVTYIDFVLQEEFEELGIGKSIGLGFLQA